MLSHILTLSDEQNALPCRPFAADRNGTVPGEGCGVIALELYQSAVNRGTPVLAALAGYGAAFESDDNYRVPTACAFGNAMRSALRNAGLAPSDIDLIIAHGDGTRAGDRNETDAIHEVFSDCIREVGVFSSKGALGHLLAGAPVVDIILGIAMIEKGKIPPTLTSSPESSLRFSLVTQPLKRNLKRIMVNAQSCEGQAASIIIESVE
jgi:3-oxoacyl-[acyl-carrier-protein] synthase II